MRKLLLCALLLTPPLSCARPEPTTPKSINTCVVPELPAEPALDSAKGCGDFVCLSLTDTVSLAHYLVAVKETRLALAGCSLVTLVAQ